MKNTITIDQFIGNNHFVMDNIQQRPYEWTKDRAVRFVRDILKNPETYIGAFLTYQGDDTNGNVMLFNGQQRTITYSLLLCVIRDLYYNDLPEYAQSFISKSLVDFKGMEKHPRLTLRDEDNETFKSIVFKEAPENKKSIIYRNYIAIKNTVEEFFEDDIISLGEVVHYHIQNLKCHNHMCDTYDEGCEQFNHLNSGQQTLTESRKGIAELYNLYRTSLHKDNKTIGDFISMLSNMTDDNAAQFLALFIYYKGKDYKIKEFITAIQRLVDDNVDVVKDASDFYYSIYKTNIIENHDLFFSSKMLELAPLRQVYVDLFTDKFPIMQEVSLEEKKSAYKKFEWGCFSNSILNNGQGQSDIFKNVIRNFNNQNNEKLTTYVTKSLKEKHIFLQDFNVLRNYMFKNNTLITRLLLRIEYAYGLELNTKENVNHLDVVSAEHIHPKNPRKGLIYNCSGELTFNMGNFTLLGKKANSSISNQTFQEKKAKIYQISPYLVNNMHLKSYVDWTDDNIKDNCEWYIKQLKKFYIE